MQKEMERTWFRLPFAAESAGLARRKLDAWVSEHATGVVAREDWHDDARLVLTELVGNSVRHAEPLPDGTVEVGWLADNGYGVDIAVRDGGSASVPSVQDAGLFDTSGRGLAIVEALALRWWVDRTGARTTTHALLG